MCVGCGGGLRWILKLWSATSANQVWRSYLIQKWRYSSWSKCITIIKFGSYPFMAVYAMAESKRPSLAIVTTMAPFDFHVVREIRPDATASLERRGWNHAVFVAAKFGLATALPQECNYWFTRARAWLHNSRRWPRGQHGWVFLQIQRVTPAPRSWLFFEVLCVRRRSTNWMALWKKELEIHSVVWWQGKPVQVERRGEASTGRQTEWEGEWRWNGRRNGWRNIWVRAFASKTPENWICRVSFMLYKQVSFPVSTPQPFSLVAKKKAVEWRRGTRLYSIEHELCLTYTYFQSANWASN